MIFIWRVTRGSLLSFIVPFTVHCCADKPWKGGEWHFHLLTIYTDKHHILQPLRYKSPGPSQDPHPSYTNFDRKCTPLVASSIENSSSFTHPYRWVIASLSVYTYCWKKVPLLGESPRIVHFREQPLLVSACSLMLLVLIDHWSIRLSKQVITSVWIKSLPIAS